MATNADFNNLGALAFMNQFPLIPEGADSTVDKGAYSSVTGGSRVKYMVISPGTHYSLAAVVSLGLPVGAIGREGDPQKATCQNADDAGHTRIPVFWLPYKQNSHYRMTLRAVGGAPQPDFFLTDAVDGCSVYVEGTRTTPTVHHLNAASTKHDPGHGRTPFGTTGNFAKDTLAFGAKDAHMTNKFQTSNEPKDVANTVVGLQQAKYIKNDDYMLRDPNLIAQQKALVNSPARAVTMPEVAHKTELATQGTVFGIRDVHGDWTFYFQRRLVAIFYHNDNYHVPFVKSKWRAVGYRMYPVLIQEFWPGGGANLVVRP